MKKFLNALKNALLAPFGHGPWSDEYQLAIALVPKALEAVQFVAELTNSGKDDLILEKIRPYVFGQVTIEDFATDRGRSALLQAAARALLQDKVRELVPDRILNTAIELAYIAFRNGKRA